MSEHMDPLDALKHELASVSVSPDFATRVRTQILAEAQEDELQALGRELSGVSVSPEFAARVRQGIETAPSRSGWLGFLNWRWAVPVAAAATIALTMIVWRTGTEMPGPIVAQVTPHAGPESRVPTVPPQVTPTNPAVGGGVQTTAQSQVARASTVRVASAAVTSESEKLEVITDQPELFRQMWAAAAIPIVVASGDVPAEVREVAIGPVEVAPVVVQWLVEPPVSSGGGAPAVRRISADAERSDK